MNIGVLPELFRSNLGHSLNKCYFANSVLAGGKLK